MCDASFPQQGPAASALRCSFKGQHLQHLHHANETVGRISLIFHLLHGLMGAGELCSDHTGHSERSQDILGRALEEQAAHESSL